jgi:hypothetical protein
VVQEWILVACLLVEVLTMPESDVLVQLMRRAWHELVVDPLPTAASFQELVMAVLRTSHWAQLSPSMPEWVDLFHVRVKTIHRSVLDDQLSLDSLFGPNRDYRVPD